MEEQNGFAGANASTKVEIEEPLGVVSTMDGNTTVQAIEPKPASAEPQKPLIKNGIEPNTLVSGEPTKTLENFIEGKPAGDGQEHTTQPKKRERSNAKAVECYDMDDNLIESFRSGMAASQKLNIPQGDISLCCRGLKQSVLGYKFRFQGETEEMRQAKLKKGFVLEGIVPDDTSTKLEMTRTTRASRGEYGQGSRFDQKNSILAPAAVKSRTWTQTRVRVGPFMVKRWQASAAAPTQLLQEHLHKGTDRKVKSSRRR
mmetsp:Transcript_25040/g.41729  ORF Transcript_25040/g.41729 Transcript_25040/m.41729 type:complete len:258 (+) Transcript_25040:62-835(+)